MSTDATPAPEHPELAGLRARQASLEEKAKNPGLSDDAKARTALYLQQVRDRIKEISKA